MGSRTVSWLRLCRTVRSPHRPMRVMVHRSPFLTQSVAVSRSRRSLLRVMITSTLAWFRQPGAPSDRVTVGATIAGAAVEFGDQLAGGGEHDRVKSGSLVRDPSSEGILGGLGKVAHMNPAVSEVEVECLKVCLRGGRVMLLLRRG